MGLLLNVVASGGVDLAAVASEVLPRAGLKADRVRHLASPVSPSVRPLIASIGADHHPVGSRPPTLNSCSTFSTALPITLGGSPVWIWRLTATSHRLAASSRRARSAATSRATVGSPARIAGASAT